MLNKKVKYAGLSRHGDLMSLPGMDPIEDGIKPAHMGMRIKTLREKNNLTQEELALLCGVTKSAVSYWESGKTRNISLDIFWRLLDALGVKITQAEFLVFGPEGAPPKAPLRR
jgi:DNA-binding XRE family transcriptional regulator